MSSQATETNKASGSALLTYSDTVSVVIPCYNEERYIGESLQKLADQFPRDRYEIIVVDGSSGDGTRAVIDDFKKKHPDLDVSIIDNPARHIPRALNLGIQAARGEIIARMDAHAIPSERYIRRCVEVIGQPGVGVVGMPCIVRPGGESLIAEAIAGAVSHPFGIGDAKYRLGTTGFSQESVDTVAFACFKKSLWQQLGGFNESLITNEDYDFNYRVRKSGQLVVLDRTEHADYFARPTLVSLSAQYRRYGFWKAAMVRLAPSSIKLRHLVAPAFVLSLIVLGTVSVFWRPAGWLLLFELFFYLLAALAAGYQIAKRNGASFKAILITPAAFATIHLSWGASFLFGLIRSAR